MFWLEQVVGKSGAQKLLKAIKNSPELKSFIFPRVIVSWLNTISELPFNGKIPISKENSVLFKLNKSENKFNGHIELNGQLHPIKNEELLHVAAAVGLALGLDIKKSDLSEFNLGKLGQQIDLLVKTQILESVKEHYFEQNDDFLHVPFKSFDVKCSDCGQNLISDAKFTGCICLKELASLTKSIKTENGLILNLSKLDQDEIGMVLSCLKVK